MKQLLIFTVLTVFGASAEAASFDCAKASTPIEKIICADAQLSELDSQLMSAYKKSMADSPNADAVKAEQRLWLKEVRNSCQDAACLKQAYTGRISALTPTPAANISESSKATLIESAPAEQPITQTNNTAPTTTAAAQSVTDATSTVAASTSASIAPEEKNDAAASKEDDVTPPSAGISGIFNAVYFALTALFIAGLVNPKWILRWDANPNRKKLAAYFFAVALPIGLLGEFTKNEATRKYEAKLIAAKEAQKKAEGEAKQRDRDRAIAASQASNGVSRKMSSQQLKDMCNKGSMYALAYMQAKKSGEPTGSLYANMNDDIGAYPVSMRPSIQNIWQKMFQMVDSGRDPRAYGDTTQQTAAAMALSVGCMRALQGPGLID